MRKPRAGLLALYVPFYEGIADLREEKRLFADSLPARLTGVDVSYPGIVASIESAREAAEQFRQDGLDAIVVAPSLAVFGALGWTALESLDLPVALWSVQPARELPQPYGIQELIRNSGNLGVEALANTLVREGRFFRTFFSTESAPTPDALMQFLRVSAVVADLRRATFGRVGSIFPQMTDVQMDVARWTATTGSRVLDVGPAELTAIYNSQKETAVGSRVTEMTAAHPASGITPDELARSARLSLALDEIVDRFALDGGAFNCHGENCLHNESIGVTACYAVSRQTTQGRPFSCTGDLPTAIALFLMKRLTGRAIYGELDFVDAAGNFVVIANGGEADFDAGAGPVRLCGNENFAGIHGRGASPQIEMQPGPATLLSFSPVDHSGRYRLIAATGELVDHPIEVLKVFHRAFRFHGLSAARAFELWCDSGAIHHLALAPGAWIPELRLLAQILKFEFIHVGGCFEA